MDCPPRRHLPRTSSAPNSVDASRAAPRGFRTASTWRPEPQSKLAERAKLECYLFSITWKTGRCTSRTRIRSRTAASEARHALERSWNAVWIHTHASRRCSHAPEFGPLAAGSPWQPSHAGNLPSAQRGLQGPRAPSEASIRQNDPGMFHKISHLCLGGSLPHPNFGPGDLIGGCRRTPA